MDKSGGWIYTTTAHLVLEPLLFGFLPSTAVITVYWVIGIVLASAFVAPYVIRAIESIPRTDAKAQKAE